MNTKKIYATNAIDFLHNTDQNSSITISQRKWRQRFNKKFMIVSASSKPEKKNQHMTNFQIWNKIYVNMCFSVFSRFFFFNKIFQWCVIIQLVRYE